MEDKELNKRIELVAYRSCLDSYMESKDRDDIVKYWIRCLDSKHYAQAKGVEKALEVIDIMQSLDAEK